MAEIFLNAPIQKDNFDPESQPGKVVPLFVAEWIRKHCDSAGSPTDLWSIANGYEGEASLRTLKEKYQSELLSALPGSSERAKTDMEPDFHEWVCSLIDTLLREGTIKEGIHGAHLCATCGNILSLAEGGATVSICNICSSRQITLKEVVVLTADISRDTIDRAYDASNGTFDTRSYPEHRTVLNKRRANGVGLEEFGYSGQVLDPKVCIGMLAIYEAQRQGAEQVSLVASRSCASHNLPQTYGFLGEVADQLPALKMVPIAKAPVSYLKNLVDQGVLTSEEFVSSLSEKLPHELLHMKKDMSPQTAERIIFGRNID